MPDEIVVDYAPGEVIEVDQHDGTSLRLRKLDPAYDPRDRLVAMNLIAQRQAQGEVVTGLLYIDPEAGDLHGHLNTVDVALNALNARELNPGAEALARINARLR